MAIEIKATCDARGCCNEIDLPVEVDGMMNNEIAYLFNERGWVKDTDSKATIITEKLNEITRTTGKTASQWAEAHGFSRKDISLVRNHDKRNSSGQEVASLEKMRRMMEEITGSEAVRVD